MAGALSLPRDIGGQTLSFGDPTELHATCATTAVCRTAPVCVLLFRIAAFLRRAIERRHTKCVLYYNSGIGAVDAAT